MQVAFFCLYCILFALFLHCRFWGALLHSPPPRAPNSPPQNLLQNAVADRCCGQFSGLTTSDKITGGTQLMEPSGACFVSGQGTSKPVPRLRSLNHHPFKAVKKSVQMSGQEKNFPQSGRKCALYYLLKKKRIENKMPKKSAWGAGDMLGSIWGDALGEPHIPQPLD